MASPRSFLLVITFFLCTIAPHGAKTRADGPTQDLINKICTKCEDYGFCNRIINDNMKTRGAGIRDLVDLIVYLALEHSTNTYIFIGNILRGRPDRPAEVSGLMSCLQAYSEEANIYADARMYFLNRDYYSMLVLVLDSPKVLGNCPTNFTIPTYKKNPLIEMNREMRILATMSGVSGYMLMR